MPDKHEVGGSSPLGPTSETQSVSQVIGNNEEGRSEVLGREETDSQFVVIDTFLEKRTAGNEPTESQRFRMYPRSSR